MQKATGGMVICLLNAETLKNPYSHLRQKLVHSLNDAGAEIEYIENAFLDADRRTDVEIALIKVQYESPANASFILQEYLKRKELPEDDTPDSTAIIHSDFIKRIVQQYNAEVDAGLRLIREYQSIKPYILRSLEDEAHSDGILKLTLDSSGRTINEVTGNEFVRKVRKKYWSALFQSSEFMKLLTCDLVNLYMQKVDELSDFDFSLYNIYTLRLEMSKLLNNSVEDTILKLFDDFTYHYSYEKEGNIH